MIVRGWILDIYTDARRGLVVWLAGEDGKRYELTQDFPAKFYVTGDISLLRGVWQYLTKSGIRHERERVRKKDSTGKEYDLLSVEVINPFFQPKLFKEIEKNFPKLTFFDCDIPIGIRYAAIYDAFPTCRCELDINSGKILNLKTLSSRWELFPQMPILRLMRIVPNVDPFHEKPELIQVQSDGVLHEIPLKSARRLIGQLSNLIDKDDPDLILSDWGDTWLFPLIQRTVSKYKLEFNPNRDKTRPPRHIKENSYFTYGRVIYRGEQTHLYGRWHIDRTNSMAFGEYGVPGAIEQAQMTGVPVQEMARKSPGAGITAMFMLTSLKRGVLFPNEKVHVEKPKTLRQLFIADKGGLVYQPTLGLHKNVVQIDYSSMYPSIMAVWNVSPETIGVASKLVRNVPELDIPVDQERRGIVSETLTPLLEKRLALKKKLGEMDTEDVEYKMLDARTSALKWLLVVCFGYQGYKNFREGRIEAHEAITAFSRSVLFRTMRIAESMGYQVLHMYVDSVWIKRPNEMPISKVEIQRVLDRVEAEIGLPISTEACYRWVAFLPARGNPDISVPNRYFGELEDGTFKVRGIASRRHDTPQMVSDLENQILECLAENHEDLSARIADVVELLRDRVDELRRFEVPIDQLVVGSIKRGGFRVTATSRGTEG
jgi:DNA polymerase-2